jgi:hypothetical protein
MSILHLSCPDSCPDYAAKLMMTRSESSNGSSPTTIEVQGLVALSRLR